MLNHGCVARCGHKHSHGNARCAAAAYNTAALEHFLKVAYGIEYAVHAQLFKRTGVHNNLHTECGVDYKRIAAYVHRAEHALRHPVVIAGIGGYNAALSAAKERPVNLVPEVILRIPFRLGGQYG